MPFHTSIQKRPIPKHKDVRYTVHFSNPDIQCFEKHINHSIGCQQLFNEDFEEHSARTLGRPTIPTGVE